MPERIGHVSTIASILCAIHCALMPVLLVAAPAASEAFLHDARLEWTVFVLIVVFAAIGLISGYRRHRSHQPPMLAFGGIALLALGLTQFHGGTTGMVLAVGGGLMLAVSQFYNVRLRRLALQVAS